MMAVVSYFLAFILAVLLVYVLRYSGRLRFRLEESFSVSSEDLASTIADLDTWIQWDPWQDHDVIVLPQVERDDAGRPVSFSWQSEKAPKILVVNRGPLRKGCFVQRLYGSAPFSFKGNLTWVIEPDGEHAKLTLSFKGRVGFAQRAFAKTVQKMLSLDFSYALNKLEDYFANQSGSGQRSGYRIQYSGACSVAARALVAREYEGVSKNIGLALQPLIANMKAEISPENQLAEAEVHYLQTNLKTGITKCKYGIQPDSKIEASNLQCAPCLTFVTRLYGDLKGLEVAWYLAMQQIRVSGDQPDQRIPPFERYHYQLVSGVAEVAYVDLYFPIKKLG